MPKTRIAQIGQLSINRPFFEVLVDGKPYLASVNKQNLVDLVPPSFLKSIGVNSLIVNRYLEPDNVVRNALGIVNNSAANNGRFTYASLGSGFGFVSDFHPVKGWSGLTPLTYKWID